MSKGGVGNMKTEIRHGIRETFNSHPAIIEPERRGTPGDESSHRDRNQSGRDAAIFYPTEPAQKNNRKTSDTDDGGHEHFQRRSHGNKGDGDAGQRTKQGGARRDFADNGTGETTSH